MTVFAIRFGKKSVGPIFIKNDNLCFYTVHIFFACYFIFELWFVDIILKIFHIMATANFQNLLYDQCS